MALLGLQKVDKSGAAATYAAATTGPGDTFPANGSTFIEVINGGVGATTVTIAAVTSTTNTPQAGELTVPDISVSIPAGATRKITPPPTHIDKGIATVTYSVVTSVTVAAFYVSQN